MTPTSSTAFKPCLHLQQILDKLEPETRVRQETPVVDFLLSQQNVAASGVTIPLNQFNGKYADANKKGLVKFTYFKEVSTLESDAIKDDWCAAVTSTNGDADEQTDEIYTDLGVNFDIVLDYDGQHDVCYNVEKVKSILIDARKRVKLKELEKVVTQSLTQSAGAYAGQLVGNSLSNPYSINVVNDFSQLNPAAINAMQNEFYKKEFSGDVKWFGDAAGYLAAGISNKQFGAPNTFQGTDATKLAIDFAGVFGFNQYTGFAAGADHVLGIPYGSYRLIEYFDNQGDYNQGKSGFLPGRTSYRTIMELWGMEWDVKVTRTDCKDHFFFQKRMGVLPVPTGAYFDKLALHFAAGCGAFNCESLTPLINLTAAE